MTQGTVGNRTAGMRPTPEELLAERFARGEIDEQEYRTRLDTLTHERRATCRTLIVK